MTSCDRRTWLSMSLSRLLATTSPLTLRRMSVTSSGRSSISRMNCLTSGKFCVIAWLMCCSRIVLPLRGGATISARWPRPSGVSRSMTRVVSGLRAGFQAEPLVRVDRRLGVERLDVEVFVRRHAVDVGAFAEPRPLLPAGRLDGAADHHPFAQAVLLDHRARHERIAPLAGVVIVGAAEKAVAVGVHFEHAVTRLERGFGRRGAPS